FFKFAGHDPDHKTSTYQDIIKEKRTEVAFFNGYIVEQGKRWGIETPTNLAILNLISIIEQGFR
ncbi:MAG: 2-dehydropantoate 2-reductase, partial [Candidatus Lokiarchaeota archaeon]|nr:2-dehydropantoate 2-reductase [Candidatus Lokiarchaeota archaeon]